MASPPPTQISTPAPAKTPRSLVPPILQKLSIGDNVSLPEGQHGILRYIGPINGKNGEFAGVELIGEYSSLGRHNGYFEGYVQFV